MIFSSQVLVCTYGSFVIVVVGGLDLVVFNAQMLLIFINSIIFRRSHVNIFSTFF